MSAEELRAQLEAAGARLAAADAERQAAMGELGRLARLAKDDLPIRQIALLGGVTRTTVYKMLDES